jgi:hypothetical protein
MNIFLVIFLWIIQDLLIKIIPINQIVFIDFWTLKMVFVYFIGKKMFNIQIYRHQIFSIYFISIVCTLLLLISFILSIVKEENKLYGNNRYFIPIGIFICLFNLLIDSFVNWKLKWLMDLKYISSNKLFMFYGIFGFIINSIISTITTFFDCGDKLNICKVETKGKKYFDSFVAFSENFSKTHIILIILYVITFILKCFFYLLIIKYLTPFHIVSLPTIYYFILHIILGIYTFAKNNETFQGNIVRIILELLTYFFAFLSFFIFLEFIELNFCLCNYNLRKYIAQRSELESNTNNNFDDTMISEEEKEKSYDSQSELSLN